MLLARYASALSGQVKRSIPVYQNQQLDFSFRGGGNALMKILYTLYKQLSQVGYSSDRPSLHLTKTKIHSTMLDLSALKSTLLCLSAFFAERKQFSNNVNVALIQIEGDSEILYRLNKMLSDADQVSTFDEVALIIQENRTLIHQLEDYLTQLIRQSEEDQPNLSS